LGSSTQPPLMPLCWSYARTSTARQAGADKSGMARQEAALAQWLADHPDYQLQAALIDPGVSGAGAHRKRGAMGKFLAAAEAGTVPPGSVLVVESLTRFGRETPREALGVLLSDFWGRGLSLAICGQAIYSPELIDKEPHRLHVLLALIQQSRAEWEERSKRSRGARVAERRKQEEGVKVRSRVPFFIKRDAKGVAVRDENDDFVLDPVGTATVRRMIELHMTGHGGLKVARILNQEKRPVSLFAKEWNDSQVRKTLKNPNLMGSLKRIDGKVLPGYYPAICDQAEFEEIQRKFERHQATHMRGHYSRCWNLVQGVSTCTECGGPLSHMANSGAKRRYIRCRHALRSQTCNQTASIAWEDWEPMVQAVLQGAQWQQLLTRPEDNAERSELEQQAKDAQGKLDATKAQLEHAQRMAEELFLSGSTETRQATAERAIKRLESEVERLVPAAEAAKQRLAIATAAPSPAALADVISSRLEEFRGKLDQPEQREAFNRWLKSSDPPIRITATPNDGTISLHVGDQQVGPMRIDGSMARMALQLGGHSLQTNADGTARFDGGEELNDDDVSID